MVNSFDNIINLFLRDTPISVLQNSPAILKHDSALIRGKGELHSGVHAGVLWDTVLSFRHVEEVGSELLVVFVERDTRDLAPVGVDRVEEN